MIIAIAGVVVLLVLGAVGAVAMFSSFAADPVSARGTVPPPTYDNGAPAPGLPPNLPPLPTDTKTVTLNAPDRIGSLHKQADQSTADRMRTDMSNAGTEQPFAVVYDDTAAKGHRVIVWGGTGALFGAGSGQAQVDQFISTVGIHLGSHVTVDAGTPADPGALGGAAECAKVNGLGVVAVVCAWAGDDALLAFLFSGVTPEKANQLFATTLPAIATES